MPMRWDDRARMTLLLKLIEQNPSILSKVNAETLASSWPGPEKPTGRAIIEQIKTIKKQVATGNVTAPTTPRRGGSTSGVSSAPRTPKTPARATNTTETSSSSKRGNTSSHHSPNDSASKKRKLAKKHSDSESEAPELTSSADETGDNQETEEDETPALSTARRELPACSKSRSKSYVAEADSAGEDDCAKDPHSDDDAEFSLDVEAQVMGREKKRLTPGVSSRDKQLKYEEVNLDENTDEELGLRDEPDDSDVESRTTAGKSHQTYVSALDEI